MKNSHPRSLNKAKTELFAQDVAALEQAQSVLERFGYAPTAKHLGHITKVIREKAAGERET